MPHVKNHAPASPARTSRTIMNSIKKQIDCIRDTVWFGGISNPLEVIEQITCLLFIRRLDDLRMAGSVRTGSAG